MMFGSMILSGVTPGGDHRATIPLMANFANYNCPSE
jgi:hypothetical protein